MSLPLIHPDWNLAIWAVLMFLAAFGFWSDKTKLGQNVSGAALIMALAMLLSNIGILPKQAEAYGVVWSYLVPCAIPLLLLKADLRRVIAETGGMSLAFLFGAIGTTVAAVIGFYLLPLGEEAPKLAGIFSATYIGGSMNFAAVSEAVGLDKSLFAAAIAADNVVGVIYMAILAIIPSTKFFQKLYSHSPMEIPRDMTEEKTDETVPIHLSHIGFFLGLSFTICAVGKVIADYFGIGGYSIMFITAITLLIANLFPKQLKKLKGDYEIGLFFMYLFFAAIGVSADIAEMLDKALVIALYATIILLFHGLFIFGISRFFKLDLMDVVLASTACALGPANAAALATGKGRRDLVAPAILIGILGYAVANFIGIGLTAFLT